MIVPEEGGSMSARMVTIEQLAAQGAWSTKDAWQAIFEYCVALDIEGLWPWIAQNAYDHNWSPDEARVWANTAYLAYQHPDPTELIAKFTEQWCTE